MNKLTNDKLHNSTKFEMINFQKNKPEYNLEERTYQFAKAVRLFVKTLPRTITNIENGKQLVKASGSVRANYRKQMRH